MFSKHSKLIESSPQLNIVKSYRTLVPYTSLYSITYNGLHRHDDYAIEKLLSSVKYHYVTTTVKLIVVTKKLLTDVYAIGYK